MELLRDPENGCPWDLKQTFSSIAPFTIEEAYEVSQAIQDDDFDGLKDELGDLLLQVIFHSQLASEKNYFDFNDVVTAITKKLIRRHPHIFEKNLKIKTAEEVKKQWDKIKIQEKRTKKNNLIRNQTLFIGDASTDYEAAKFSSLKFALREADYNIEYFNKLDVYKFKHFDELNKELNQK